MLWYLGRRRIWCRLGRPSPRPFLGLSRRLGWEGRQGSGWLFCSIFLQGLSQSRQAPRLYVFCRRLVCQGLRRKLARRQSVRLWFWEWARLAFAGEIICVGPLKHPKSVRRQRSLVEVRLRCSALGFSSVNDLRRS